MGKKAPLKASDTSFKNTLQCYWKWHKNISFRLVSDDNNDIIVDIYEIVFSLLAYNLLRISSRAPSGSHSK